MKKNIAIWFITNAIALGICDKVFAQHCPEIIGFNANHEHLPCVPSGLVGFYMISTQPFNPNPNGSVLTLAGCQPTNFAVTVNNHCVIDGIDYYYVVDEVPFPCLLSQPWGTVQLANGATCQYENGIYKECHDLTDLCEAPIIEFAQDFIENTGNCKLWEGPCNTASEIWRAGNVLIGTEFSENGFKLGVKGGITTEMLQICKSAWCDYVFSDSFQLLPLAEVQRFILKHGHLPNSTPAQKVFQDGGLMLDEETVSQQEKIEEIFLHLIGAQQRLDRAGKKVIMLAPAAKLVESPSTPTEFGASEYPIASNNLLQIACFQLKASTNGIAKALPE